MPEFVERDTNYKDAQTYTMQENQTRNDKAFEVIENTIIPWYDWQDHSNPITIVAHERRERVKKPFLSWDVNNNERLDGWEATGYFNWEIEKDTLMFKAYTYEITERRKDYNPHIYIYRVPELPQLPFLIVRTCKGDRSVEETGLYVMRKTEY